MTYHGYSRRISDPALSEDAPVIKHSMRRIPSRQLAEYDTQLY